MTKASVVISYCSLDKRFIGPLLEQVLMFTDDVIIVSYDKLLNGTEENSDDVQELINIKSDKIAHLILKYTADKSSRYFHNLARWEGMKLAKHDNILFLDADEIPEGQVMKAILDNDLLKEYDAVDFRCYWYFRSAKYQAKQTEECGLLVKRNIITEQLMFTESERWSFRQTRGIKYLPRASTQNGPFMHHFSWTRTKAEMITKVSAWGHKNDKNWNTLIEEEFSREFNGKDFVHGYSFIEVDDKFNLGI